LPTAVLIGAVPGAGSSECSRHSTIFSADQDNAPTATFSERDDEPYSEEFFIATECGFGRRDPRTIPELLRIHAEVADLD
jgi:hypothetical protein